MRLLPRSGSTAAQHSPVASPPSSAHVFCPAHWGLSMMMMVLVVVRPLLVMPVAAPRAAQGHLVHSKHRNEPNEQCEVERQRRPQAALLARRVLLLCEGAHRKVDEPAAARRLEQDDGGLAEGAACR